MSRVCLADECLDGSEPTLEPERRPYPIWGHSSGLNVALGCAGVGLPQGFQIFLELGQKIAYRLDHCLHTHSFRFLQIVKYFSAPAYRRLCLAYPVSYFSNRQL